MTSLAFADTTTKGDKKGDSQRGEYDLKSATVAHVDRDTVRHTVTTYNTSKQGRSLRLDLGTGPGRPCCYVGRFDGKAGIYQYGRRGPKRIGPAKFKQHAPKKFSYTFDLKPFNYPEKYRWQWAVQVMGEFEPADTLPNRGMVTHNLATGHD